MPRRQSVWSATAEMPACGPLERNIHVDVCIVGGGIAGLSTAYHLTKLGWRDELALQALGRGQLVGLRAVSHSMVPAILPIISLTL